MAQIKRWVLYILELIFAKEFSSPPHPPPVVVRNSSLVSIFGEFWNSSQGGWDDNEARVYQAIHDETTAHHQHLRERRRGGGGGHHGSQFGSRQSAFSCVHWHVMIEGGGAVPQELAGMLNPEFQTPFNANMNQIESLPPVEVCRKPVVIPFTTVVETSISFHSRWS